MTANALYIQISSLDKGSTSAEFRVAGAGSGTDPWFSVTQAEFPWLAALGAEAEIYSPLELRRALMTYLMRLTHRQNPLSESRSEWTPEQAAEQLRATVPVG